MKVLHEALRIPTLISKLTGGLMTLSPLIAPDQDLVNETTRQLQEGGACIPRFNPYVIDQLHLGPFRSPFPSHGNIVADWAERMKNMRPSQPLPFQAYLLYQSRFIMAGQICSAWEHFGGFSAQMNAQAAMLTLAETDNAGVAISYDLQIRKHIAHLARQRRADIDFDQLLSKRSEDLKKQVTSRRTTKTLTTDKDPKKKGEGKGKGKTPFVYKKTWGEKQWAVKNLEYNGRSDYKYGPEDRSQDNDKHRAEGSAHGRKDSPKRPNENPSQKKKDKK